MPTKISWTDETWNPITGCSRVSEGCRNCYAERLSLKNGWSKTPWTAANAAENVICHPERLRKPYSFKPGTRVFTNSMSDMFHEQVPDSFLIHIVTVMNLLPLITFQCLTKRADRAAEWSGPWTPNIWMGTSIEDRKSLHRLDEIRRCKAKVRFVSFEPLLEDVGPLDLTGIHWVIVGGESGPGFRPLDHAWARSIRDQCVSAGVPFFFKQDSAIRPEARPWLIEADGTTSTWRQFPCLN